MVCIGYQSIFVSYFGLKSEELGSKPFMKEKDHGTSHYFWICELVASLSWYDFKVCLHCSVYLYFILLCVRLLHCVDVPLVVCPSS